MPVRLTLSATPIPMPKGGAMPVCWHGDVTDATSASEQAIRQLETNCWPHDLNIGQLHLSVTKWSDKQTPTSAMLQSAEELCMAECCLITEC